MINESMFRLKKNGEPRKRCCFCRHPELIENYDKAIADTTQTWECHHRLETHNSDGEERLVPLSKEELKTLDMYYDRPPEELIFLTRFEHTGLHTKLRNHINPPVRGRHRSTSWKMKVSSSTKGRKLSDEWKSKLSASHKGKHWKLVDGKRVYY